MASIINHTCPDCGQCYRFGSSFGGSPQICKCGATFTLPVDLAYEAMKTMEWSIRPLGTHRGIVHAKLVRCGQSPARIEIYVDPATGKTFKCLIWPDRTMWMESQALDALERASKGKRKGYPVTPVEVS